MGVVRVGGALVEHEKHETGTKSTKKRHPAEARNGADDEGGPFCASAELRV